MDGKNIREKPEKKSIMIDEDVHYQFSIMCRRNKKYINSTAEKALIEYIKKHWSGSNES